MIKKTVDPKWTEGNTFVFTPKGAENEIRLRIYDKDMTSDDKLGELDLNLMTSAEPVDQWYPVKKQGEIRLITHFVTIDSLLATMSAAVMAAGGGSAETKKLADEVAAVRTERQELEGKLAKVQATLKEAQKEKAALEAENAELQAEHDKLRGSAGVKAEEGVKAGVGKVKGLFKK